MESFSTQDDDNLMGIICDVATNNMPAQAKITFKHTDDEGVELEKVVRVIIVPEDINASIL